MKHDRLVLTRPLPKTGQTQQYQAGDDGYIEAGWWRGRLNVNNKTRFIAKTLDGDDVVIDLATGLMWAADGNSSINHLGNVITWPSAVDFPFGKEFAGFSDWRLANINELLSIVDYSQSNPAINEILFPNTSPNPYWSSTTYSFDTDKAWYEVFLYGHTVYRLKTDSCRLRCVRGGV
ncbi:hypothetical protein ES703_53941 [subsurface metagenome]